MKHKHHDLIVAWAADTTRKVEVLRNGRWFEADPAWDPREEYRFAPVKHDVWLLLDQKGQCFIFGEEANAVAYSATHDGEVRHIEWEVPA